MMNLWGVGRCIVQKYRLSSNLGVIAPPGCASQKCDIKQRCWKNQRRLSIFTYFIYPVVPCGPVTGCFDPRHFAPKTFRPKLSVLGISPSRSECTDRHVDVKALASVSKPLAMASLVNSLASAVKPLAYLNMHNCSNDDEMMMKCLFYCALKN